MKQKCFQFFDLSRKLFQNAVISIRLKKQFHSFNLSTKNQTTINNSTLKNIQISFYSDSVLIESTHKKLLQAYADSQPYVKKLLDEKSKLMKIVNDEHSLTDLNQDKLSVFKRLNYLTQINELYEKIENNLKDIKELSEAARNEEDQEMAKLIRQDLKAMESSLGEQKYQMIQLLIPDEQEDKEDALVEVSAGVGGSESRLFCSEIYEMYKAYASMKNWQFNTTVYDTESEMLRKASVEISGTDVFKYFKFESGVHRVQRVPKTEAKGRIHTSTVGVVVTPKPSEIKIEINPKDLKIESKTHGGPGGQHANKTESAIRLTHLPTGIVINCAAERFQFQNKSQAMKMLQLRLYQIAFEEQLNKKQANRKMQIGSSSRSERIRTYNFIQDRITDHRLQENFTGMLKFMSGESLIDMIENLKAEQQVELLYETLEENNKDSSSGSK
jgi:peptide chain release factor 1